MPLNNAQIEALSEKLPAEAVKTRKGAGNFQLSYVEGWYAIQKANEIFGYDGWSRETVEMSAIHDPYEKDGKYYVGYRAKCKITLDDCLREGTGYGSGVSRNLGDAIEGAIKEAETDAMKRALMTFGDQFGLALYDKDQANVAPKQSSNSLRKTDEWERFESACRNQTSVEGLIDWYEKAQKHTEHWPQKWKEQALELVQKQEADLRRAA